MRTPRTGVPPTSIHSHRGCRPHPTVSTTWPCICERLYGECQLMTADVGRFVSGFPKVPSRFRRSRPGTAGTTHRVLDARAVARVPGSGCPVQGTARSLLGITLRNGRHPGRFASAVRSVQRPEPPPLESHNATSSAPVPGPRLSKR
ncbi:hypothetical protein C8Q77DRAFT_324270 [Trametes polyzona]|nr:hypothetical protein C8Q77DRAFT_324270 [Trametes polyzona]